MLDGVEDHQPEASLDVIATQERKALEKTWSYAIWLFLCQVYALSWKQFLIKKRRPISTIFEILAPSLMLCILVYGIKMSPTVPTDAFVYDQVPVVTTRANMSSTPVDNSTAALMALLEQAHLFAANNPTSYFETVFLPMLSSRNSSLASQIAALTIDNSKAATPFIISSFDNYVTMMTVAKTTMAQQGRKSLQHLVPLLWHIMNNGKIGFVPQGKDVQAMIDYFNKTTNSFGPLLALCPSSGAGPCDGFPSVAAAEAEASAQQVAIWAIVEFHELNITTGAFDYTIRMNQSLVPDTNVIIDKFPQGLGSQYANYIYSGFTTIQFELNEYFRRASVQAAVLRGAIAPPVIRFGVIPLFESSCNSVLGQLYMFASPTDFTQMYVLGTLESQPPTPTVTVLPSPFPNTLYPCASTVIGHCNSTSNQSLTSMLQCLRDNNASTGACGTTMSYVESCGYLVSAKCGIANLADVFLNSPNPIVSCWPQLRQDAQCGQSSPFGQLIASTTEMLNTFPCIADSLKYCGTPASCATNINSCSPDYQCLKRIYDTQQAFLSPLCEAIVYAVPQCSDDLATVCPFNPSTDSLEAFPTLCLHLQQSMLSLTCLDTPLFGMIEYVYGFTAVVTTTPTPVALCRLAHQVAMSFSDGVTAGAFPARAFEQNQFYANSGALIGLVVALSFLYPFTAHVRLIVQERQKKQRLYMMLIGVHHTAILVTYTIIGFITVFLSSLCASVTLGWIFPGVSTDTIFSLVFTYAFSLIGLASLVSSFFDNTRHAGAVAPFVLFMFAIPAFVVVGEVDFMTTLLSPSVTILAADLFVGYSQSSASPEVFQDDLTKATRGLFGLAIMYLILAIIVEQLRVMSTSIGMVGSFSRRVSEGLFGAYRFVVKPFRKTRIYQRVNQRTYGNELDDVELVANNTAAQDDEEQASTSLNSGGGGGYGYENFDESSAAAPQNNAANLRYEIGGVSMENERSQGGGEDMPSDSGRSFTEKRSEAWRVCVAMFDLTLHYLTTTSRKDAVRGVTGVLYQNKLNCIIGGTGSGKSTLIRMLMGEWSPASGRYTINGSDPTEYNRQNMGVCLQDDVTWDQLTVKEHIELIQLVKGCINLDFMKNETETLLNVLNLHEKKDCHADTLSFGMLRKLSVAMSFAGGSRTILLDEPTASVDPLSRRAVWHLLGNNASGRCIVVSTSYVDELDDAHHLVLLDRGAVKCSGTPEYVRTSFGGGWILSVCRGPQVQARNVLMKVAELAPGSQLINNVGQELCFRLHNLSQSQVEVLVGEVQSMEEVSGVALSDHRLDEIFMRVTQERGIPAVLLNPTTETVAAGAAPSTGGEPGSHYTRAPSDPIPASESNLVGGSGGGDGSNSDDDQPTTTRSSQAALGRGIEALSQGNTIGGERERLARLQRGSYSLFHQTFTTILAQRFAAGLNTFLGSIIAFMLPLICISFAMDLLNVPTPAPPPLLLSPNSLYGPSEMLFGSQLSSAGDTFLYNLFFRGQTLLLYANALWTSSVNESLTLRDEMDSHSAVRYGAVFLNDTFVEFDIQMFAEPLDVNVANQTVLWNSDTILHNTSSPHALPSFLTTLATARLQFSLNNSQAFIRATSFPLPYSSGAISVATLVVNMISSILLLVPFTFFPAQFVATVVKEREVGLLDAESNSLLSPLAYWIANFTWNMVVFSLFSACSIILYMSSHDSLIEGLDAAMYTWFVLLLYGACVTCISYLLSKMFKKHTTAQNGVTMFHFAFGFVLVVAANAIDLLPDNEYTSSAKATNEAWMKLFRFLPTYALGESFIKLSSLPLQKYLNTNNTVQDLLAPSIKLMLMFPVYLFGLILYEQYCSVHVWKFWKVAVMDRIRALKKSIGFRYTENPWDDDRLLMVDDDTSVAAERSRALTPGGLNAVDVWKRYDKSSTNVIAVQNIALHVGRECLVVVGPNGSGKSTFLRCMAGLDRPSFGDIVNRNHSMSASTDEKRWAMSFNGYAGDLPGLDDHVSPYLMLHFMADFRGLQNNKQREQHIMFLLTAMGLRAFRNRPCGTLSLAMRRRTSVAMSLVGYPESLILDEPTTGLDPIGRRQFWATLQSVPTTTSILMSSQLSEDVDMIGSRVLLLDHGKSKQIGPVEDIRQRARCGEIVVSVFLKHDGWTGGRSQNNLRGQQKEMLTQFFQSQWPDCCQLVEEGNHVLRFRIDPSMANARLNLQGDERGQEPSAATANSIPMKNVLAAVCRQRQAWADNPAWAAESPVASSELPQASPHTTVFEVEVTQSTFGMVLDRALGSKSTTVQHMKRILNMDSTLPLRPIVE